jgi:nucleotide-binding universal stress UspA family protein
MTPCILVATDGLDGALGALRTAYLLSARDGTRVEVLAVCPPTDLYAAGAPEAVASFPVELLTSARDMLQERVARQVAELGGEASSWPVTVEVGAVAATIARVATSRSADLILLGLPPHPKMERWLARETLLRVIHLSSVPVLAVEPEARELPHRIVIATDFSEFSQRVARAALRLAAPDAHVHLVHVTWTPPPEAGWTDSDEWVRTYRTGVERRLDRMAAELSAGTRLDLHVRVLTGEPGPELLHFAEEADAQLLSTGSHGSGFLGRLVLGSVSSRLVHGARCSLLVAPPQTAAVELEPTMTEEEMMSDLGNASEVAFARPPKPA